MEGVKNKLLKSLGIRYDKNGQIEIIKEWIAHSKRYLTLKSLKYISNVMPMSLDEVGEDLKKIMSCSYGSQTSAYLCSPQPSGWEASHVKPTGEGEYLQHSKEYWEL